MIRPRPETSVPALLYRTYARASKTMLNGVSVARRTLLKPPAVMTSRIFASPACAPSPDLLGERRRNANERRGGVVDPTYGVHVILHPVTSHGLDDHPRAIGLQRLLDVRSGAGRIAHVVEAIEEGHEVEFVAGILLGGA